MYFCTDNFVCNIATCLFSNLFIPTSSSYLFNPIAIFCLHSHICHIYLVKSHPSESHCLCRRNASAFGNDGRFPSVSIFEHLPHHVRRKSFLSGAKGVQSNNKWHWKGGGLQHKGEKGLWGVGGLIHLVHTNTNINPEVCFAQQH